MHQFDEHHPAFEGFSQFYFQVIGPRLGSEEAARKAAVKKSLLITPFALFAAVLIITVFHFFFDFPTLEDLDAKSCIKFVLVYSFALGIVVCTTAHPFERVIVTTRKSLIGGFCRFKKWSSFRDGSFREDARRLLDLGLVPAYQSASFGYPVVGENHGIGFSFCRVALSKEDMIKNDPYPWKSTFTGQIIVISFKAQFRGHTVVFPDKGLLNRKKRGNMKRVRLVDPIFEKKFEVYGTDQVEARYLLSPDFMQRLVDLEHVFKGKSLRFGFIDNQLLIAIETRMRLGVGSMLRPLDDPKRMQSILDVMAAIYDVIDGVTKPQEPISVNPHATAA